MYIYMYIHIIHEYADIVILSKLNNVKKLLIPNTLSKKEFMSKTKITGLKKNSKNVKNKTKIKKLYLLYIILEYVIEFIILIK